MRLFIAVMPSEEAGEHLEEALTRVRRLRRLDGLRWTPPHQWHVTLVFLGEVADAIADDVMEPLDDVLAHCEPPRLHLAGAGVFGGSVLYAGVVDPASGLPSTDLDALAERAREVVAARGVRLERRAFRPHLTVARARGAQQRLLAVAEELTSYRGPAWTAHDVVLVQSQPNPGGRGGVVHRALSTTVVGPSR